MSVSIEELVAELLARPRPVLCLDTCDLIDVIRGVLNRDLSHSRSFIRIETALNLNATDIQVVITYLVKHEWEQNAERERNRIQSELRSLAKQFLLIGDARSHCRLSPLIVPDLDGPRIVDGLVDLVQRVIDWAAVLEVDRPSVDLALGRVMAKKRPSHKNQIKDSIHLEHYLTLARQLRSSDFTMPCLFVSGNKADFWAEGGKPRIYPDLEHDLDSAGLTFFARLEEAVRRLGI